MKLTFKILILSVFLFSFPLFASAHQPRVPIGNDIKVFAPEVSKAYYTELTGKPHHYTITSTWSFPLYVNILVPNIANQQKDFSITIAKEGATDPLAVLDWTTFAWEPLFEPFWHDWYMKWPEYSKNVEPGTYTITISSPDLQGKYSLSIGEAEVFDFTETVNAVTIIPQIKKSFFNKSPIDFILSPFGVWLIIVMYLLSFLFWFSYRYLLKYFAHWTTRGASQNISSPDRRMRALFGILLLLLAITTTWSPRLLFFSGFCFFEAIWSRCGFYAAIGKSSCPL